MRARKPWWALKTDRVRAIDRVIDYFGESRNAALGLIAAATGVSLRREAWATVPVSRRARARRGR